MTATTMLDASPVVQIGATDDGPRAGAAARYRAHLRSRYHDVLARRQDDQLRDAVRSARALVLAEALLAVVIGLSIDDLNVLRAPGFLVGIIAAVVILTFGGLWHGMARATRMRPLSPAARRDALAGRRSWGRLVLMVVVLGSVVWLAVFSSGVPPWVA